MKCPFCGGDCGKEELHTFLDYADYLFSNLCIQTVKLANGELETKDKQDLELLNNCCDSISRYAYVFDRHQFGYLATPKNESDQHD